MTQDRTGLFGKFVVRKSCGGDPIAPCFVLRYDRDPHARVALLAYADSVKGENPQLAADLYRELGRTHAAALNGEGEKA
jgi:hypothetical protein